MYSTIQINEKIYIINETGEFALNDAGIPIWFAGPISARRAVDRLNAGKSLESKIGGVMDNRSRNWRRRSR